MEKSELYKLPKDLLIKLLCTIQEDTRNKTIEELIIDDSELRYKKCEKLLDIISENYYDYDDIIEREVENTKKILSKVIDRRYSYLNFSKEQYSICIFPKHYSSVNDIIYVYPNCIEVNNTKYTVQKFLIYW